MIPRRRGRTGRAGAGTMAVVGAALVLIMAGCAPYGYRTTRRSLEVDVDADVAFRAAAATLLDGQRVFELSDRDAGLVIGQPWSEYSASGRTTFWVTPLEDDRAFVVVQILHYGTLDEEKLGAEIDAVVRRLRQRCVLGGDVEPFPRGEDEIADGPGGTEPGAHRAPAHPPDDPTETPP